MTRADSALDQGSAPQWEAHESEHITVHFLAGSPVEKDIFLVASRLEAFREATIKALGIQDLLDRRIHVYLGDVVDDADGGGEIDAEGMRVRAVYRTDAPGQGLERSVLELLVTASLGARAAQASMIVDGLLGYVDLQTGKRDPVRLRAGLAELMDDGRRISLAEFVNGPKPETRGLYHQVVTSFVAFLLTTYDAERLKRFARDFDARALDVAAEAAFGKPIATLEKEWLATLKRARPKVMGVAGFVRRSLTWLRPYWYMQAVILLALGVGTAFSTFLPLSYKFLIDRAIIPEDRGVLLLIIGVLAALFVLNTLANLVNSYVTARLSARVMNDMRMAMFTHLQDLSMGFYTRAQVGDLISRLSTDLARVESAMTGTLPLAVQLGLSVAVSGVALLVLEWRLALITMLALPVFAITLRVFGNRAARASYQRQQNAAKVASNLQENFTAQTVVKAFGLQGRETQKFQGLISELARSAIRISFLTSLMTTTVTLSAFLVQVVAIAVGAFMVLAGELTLGSLMAFIGLLANVVAPLQGATTVARNLQYATGGMQRVDELLNEEVQVVDAPDAPPLPRPSSEIRFDDVSFTYTGEQLNLNGVSFSVKAGQHVAFVGPSGCGKSTVLNLFTRLYDPVEGSITIDGHDLRHVSQASLRSHMGAVLQENILFNDTIRENIRLGRPDAADEEVEAAARAAEIHNTIAGLPRGYDTVVGERGARLSGGQRQRIAIARAVLRDPAVLVLDEATSALDPVNESAISATLERLTSDRTVLSVTHRLASVAESDRIFVLDRGRLVEQGTHEELLELDGVYGRLWKQQSGFILAEGAQYVGVEATRLQAIPMFKDLDGVLLAAIANRFITERYAEDEGIFEEGDAGDKLYIIVRGQVDVTATGATGEEKRLAVLRDGDYFGEIALLDDVPRMATIRTRASTILLALEREQFLNLLNTVPDMRTAFEQVVALRRQANVAVLQRADAPGVLV